MTRSASVGKSQSIQIKDDAVGINHIADNIHRVNISLIQTENAKIDPAEEKLRFLNPRGLQIAEGQVAGFNSNNMQQLKSAIRDHGLVNPLICRYKSDGKIYIVEGHRRFKAIQELMEENAPCYDVNSGKNVPAQELFSAVLVRLYDETFTDEDCYKLSFNEDKSKVHFGAGAEIRFTHHCIMMGTDDSSIMEMLQVTPEWLRETKNLIRQLEEDEQILNSVFNDQINRTAAKNLAQIEDWQERRDIYKEALAEAQLDCVAKIDKYKKAISSVNKSIDIVKSRKIVSDHIGDSSDSEKYDQEIEELTSKAQDLQEKIDATTPVINPDALRKGSAKVSKPKTRSGSPRIAPAERISTKWRKFFDILNERGAIGETQINDKLIAFANELLSACTDKENDPEEFMIRWNDNFCNP